MKHKRRWLIAFAAFAALLGLLIAASWGMQPSQIIAHRGANAFAPENTLPAFVRRAYAVACDAAFLIAPYID